MTAEDTRSATAEATLQPADDFVPSLENFLRPRSIAVIGAAPAQRSIRGAIIRTIRGRGFNGRIAPVNPSHVEIDGLPCFPSIGAVDFPIDLAIIAIPAASVPGAVQQCADAGIRHAIVISSGFAEESAETTVLQTQVSEIARATGIRICGPNCEGFYNIVDGIAATFSPAVDAAAASPIALPGRIAVVAQSGGLGFAIYNHGLAMGLGFSHIVTTGNECDLTAVDFLELFSSDPETSVIVTYVEAIRDPERFGAAALRARVAGKNVLAVKVGSTAAAARAALAHTGADTGHSRDSRALFEHCGVIEAADVDAAIAMSAALMSNSPALGKRIGLITTAGGAGALLCDRVGDAGFSVPRLSAGLQEQIRPAFPAYGSALNPVDVTAQGIFSGGYLSALQCLLIGDEVDMILLCVSLSNERSVSINVTELQQMLENSSKPILVYSYTLPSRLAQDAFAEAGIPVFARVADLLNAMRALTLAGDHSTPHRLTGSPSPKKRAKAVFT